jgi:ribosomal protein S18 acetylase RimI-like enzyme
MPNSVAGYLMASRPESAVIRAASGDDIDALLSIAAEGFSRSPRWRQAGAFARQWWNTALMSPFAESWVAVSEEAVVAFVVLVIDEPGWQTERTARCGSQLDYIRAMASQPAMLLPELKRRHRLRESVSQPGSPGTAAIAGERTWIELLAVSRDVRRTGAARRLEQWCEARTVALSRDRIDLTVDPDNDRMRTWCQSVGFVLAGQTRAGFLYSKQGLLPTAHSR